MFEHLQKLNPSGRTVEMELPELGPSAALTVRHAGESNVPYHQAMLRRAAKRSGALRGGKITADLLKKTAEENREEDRELLPRYVVVGWRGLRDSEGADVPYSREAAVELFEQLPGWLVDRVSGFASNPMNFIEEDEEPLDVESLGNA